jgi:hypothetical protein
MNDKREEDESWKNLLRFASYAKIRAWGLRPGLPDPTYDSGRGWALDEFAMRFEPALLQRYKKVMTNLHSPPNSRNKNHGYRWIEVSSELSDKLKAYLLDPRFRVEGFRFGAYGPTVIPRPLLEEMQPIIETSELVERGVREIYRKFEHVRVFQQERRKGRSGRPPTYNWPSLRDKLEREKPYLATPLELMEYCRANVKPFPGKRPSLSGPDDGTIRDAISKYELAKFVTP